MSSSSSQSYHQHYDSMINISCVFGEITNEPSNIISDENFELSKDMQELYSFLNEGTALNEQESEKFFSSFDGEDTASSSMTSILEDNECTSSIVSFDSYPDHDEPLTLEPFTFQEFPAEDDIAFLEISDILEPPMITSSSCDIGDDESEPMTQRKGNKVKRRKRKKALTKMGKTVPSDSIKKTDVLLGRGKRSTNHPGNILFRDVIMKSVSQYKNCSKLEKTALANKIVNQIYDHGGRFLSPQSKNLDTWVEITGLAVRKKTSQALRDSITYR